MRILVRNWGIIVWMGISLFISPGLFPGEGSKDTQISPPAKGEVILPGDKLFIRVEEDKNFGGVITVSPEGYIILPLINEIKASGLTPQELAKIIKEKLEERFFRKATVSVLFYEKAKEIPSSTSRQESGKVGKVYIFGQVKSPGIVKIPPGETLTVAEVIILAGGFSDFANKKKVKLIRINKKGEREVKILNMVRILEEGRLNEDVKVKDGDWIIVPRSFFNF